MYSVFLSDLHLEDSRPEATAALQRLLQGPARQADAVYILGDLFEFWIGDDVISDTARSVAGWLSDLPVPCYFLHGNRDFLLGTQFAGQCGMTLLPETNTIDLYGTPTLLLHGDTLCTDDQEYQAFRQQVRDPAFQAMFLQMPLPQRLEMARSARDASKQHTDHASMDIMDVNSNEVIRIFEQHQVLQMIHGHTHRPAVHQHELGDHNLATRIVLADWYSQGSYLRVDEQGWEQIAVTF